MSSQPRPCIRIRSLAETDLFFRAGLDNEVGALISIGDPGSETPWFVEYARDGSIPTLRITFDDVDAGMKDAPTKTDAKKIVSFLKREIHYLGERCLLIHCFAGISRSSATAALAYGVWDKHLSPEQIADLILEARPGAWPNECLLGLGAPIFNKSNRVAEVADSISARWS